MLQQPLKIDLHTHILPERWPDMRDRHAGAPAPRLDHHAPGCARIMVGDRVFREVRANCWDPARRLEDCDREGVHVQVLSTVPIMFCYGAPAAGAAELARHLNDHIAEVCRNRPQRFVGLGTLPMQSPDLAVRELERCMEDLGLAGVEIGTHVNGWNLDEPEVFTVLEAAAALGAAVFVHPWEMLGRERMERYWLQWLVGMPAETTVAICSVVLGGVLERLPALRIAFAHGGGAFAFVLGRIEKGYQVRPDLCAARSRTSPRQQVGRIYVDSLVHDEPSLRFLVEALGPQRVALGSDYPFPLGEEHPGRLIESLANLTEEDRRRLLSGTALEFLALQDTAFGPSPPGKGPGEGAEDRRFARRGGRSRSAARPP
jgi:aminocarboxymuconate-semialdehyde decarboxylase